MRFDTTSSLWTPRCMPGLQPQQPPGDIRMLPPFRSTVGGGWGDTFPGECRLQSLSFPAVLCAHLRHQYRHKPNFHLARHVTTRYLAHAFWHREMS